MSYRNKFEDVVPIEGEIWKVVIGWDCYMVSNLGRVKSVKRIIYHMGGKQFHEGDYLLNLKPNSNGYLVVRLYDLVGNKKDSPVHRLVATHFKKKPNGEKLEVHHKDGNKLNNIPSNLTWVTKNAHAMITIKETSFGAGQKGQAHGMCKIDSALVLKIRELYSLKCHSMSDLAKEFSLTKTHISRIINKKAWTHI